ncbi:hypothetical protein C8R44DRAFT_726824 [Mycena epipterygia]|nr:hypothetical protein C8R44DRAFT_726824 [Mycena epipterygia]
MSVRGSKMAKTSVNVLEPSYGVHTRLLLNPTGLRYTSPEPLCRLSRINNHFRLCPRHHGEHASQIRSVSLSDEHWQLPRIPSTERTRSEDANPVMLDRRLRPVCDLYAHGRRAYIRNPERLDPDLMSCHEGACLDGEHLFWWQNHHSPGFPRVCGNATNYRPMGTWAFGFEPQSKMGSDGCRGAEIMQENENEVLIEGLWFPVESLSSARANFQG